MASVIAPVRISLEEYLHASYSPDVEFVDGEILERNVGQGYHAYTQSRSILILQPRLEPLLVLTEQRTQVSPACIRIPDVCVVAKLEMGIARQPPLLCIEILSPDDRWSRLQDSLNDYFAVGVPLVWVVDPWDRRAWHIRPAQAPAEVKDGLLSAPHLNLTVELESVLPPPEN